MNIDVVQTFYIDKQSAGNRTEVYLTSVHLFFENKPGIVGNMSGSSAPGISAYICEVSNETPDLNRMLSDQIVIPYDFVYAYSDASVPTVISFETPIRLKTDATYGIAVKFDDPAYKLWVNKQNDYILGSTLVSTGSTDLAGGKFFERTSQDNLKALSDTDAKFKVNIAKFTDEETVIEMVNKDYEFLTLTNYTGTFQGGETVFQTATNSAGTVKTVAGSKVVVGSGTTFTNMVRGNHIKIGNDVHKIDYIQDNTNLGLQDPARITAAAANYAPVVAGEVFLEDTFAKKLFLINSTANTSLKFTVSGTVEGEISGAMADIASVDALPVDRLAPDISYTSPATSVLSAEYLVATANGSAYTSAEADFKPIDMNSVRDKTDKRGYIVSKSLEVAQPALYANKSAAIKMTFDHQDDPSVRFTAPVINTTGASIYALEYQISPTTIVNGLDTEVTKNGKSLTRYISSKTTFSENRFAEDIKVFITAYRPKGTNVQVYAKLHNSTDTDAFEDKLWTPLSFDRNGDVFSAPGEMNEYELSLPTSPPLAETLDGTATATLASTTITTVGMAPNTKLVAGDSIKVYDPLFPSNYSIHIVASTTASNIVVYNAFSNTDLAGSGLKVDKLKYARTAFSDMTADGQMKYFSENYSVFENFDTMQIKIVLVADNTITVPFVESLQAVAVSA